MQGFHSCWLFLKRRSLLTLGIAFCIALAISLINSPFTSARPPASSPPSSPPPLENTLSKLPLPRPHPLPPLLAEWRDPKQSGDYFDQIQSVLIGALVWSTFPITVYIEPPTEVENASPFMANRARIWVRAIEHAVQEWNSYLPLKQVTQAQGADITIRRSTPPLRFEKNTQAAANKSREPTTAQQSRPLPNLRARSAETQFELYAKKTAPNVQLAHRMTIYIRPDQAADYLQAAARHELGHALGIWGHSDRQTDALFKSQVRNPAKVSARDVNTLKRVYEQPTRLGWEMPSQ